LHGVGWRALRGFCNQGDQPNGGEKGVYHINAVDEVTQWQVAGATPRISEAYLEPVLEHMLRQFPFRILGFHSDYGSELINKTVAQLLENLRVEQTKSRPRQSGDNGLVEAKNGAPIRKHIGYGYIHASHADRINDFYREYLNPYLNYHRPCAQADVKIDEKGCNRARYKGYLTPLETLLLPDRPGQCLREGLNVNALKRVPAGISDTDAARRMQQAKAKLFERLRLTAQDRFPRKRAEEMAVYRDCSGSDAFGLSTAMTRQAESNFARSPRWFRESQTASTLTTARCIPARPVHTQSRCAGLGCAKRIRAPLDKKWAI